MRILIYGAGVIGSLYAVLFVETGYDTSIYSRGKRLEFLKKNGLLYKKKQNIRRAEATILGELSDNDAYDFILLTVREKPYQKVVDMHMWKLCHLAMVVPIADAYYEADCPERAGKDWKIMKKTAKKLKRNFSFLRKQAGRLSPCKMNIFRFLPLPIMTIMLAVTFESSFGDKFMYQHARKAPDEMRELHKQFYAYM